MIMFGRKSDPDADCRVYEYGCLSPGSKETEELFVAQIKKRNSLWNRLVEIERGYREQFTELSCNGWLTTLIGETLHQSSRRPLPTGLQWLAHDLNK